METSVQLEVPVSPIIPTDLLMEAVTTLRTLCGELPTLRSSAHCCPSTVMGVETKGVPGWGSIAQCQAGQHQHCP